MVLTTMEVTSTASPRRAFKLVHWPVRLILSVSLHLSLAAKGRAVATSKARETVLASMKTSTVPIECHSLPILAYLQQLFMSLPKPQHQLHSRLATLSTAEPISLQTLASNKTAGVGMVNELLVGHRKAMMSIQYKARRSHTVEQLTCEYSNATVMNCQADLATQSVLKPSTIRPPESFPADLNCPQHIEVLCDHFLFLAISRQEY